MREKVNTTYYGTESISIFGPKIWDILPTDLKEAGNLGCFKTELKIGKLKIALAGYVESLSGVWVFVMYDIFCNFVVLYFNGVYILSCIVIYFGLG